MENNEEEILVIENREAKVHQLIHDLMSGQKALSYSALKAFKSSPLDFVQYALRERIQTDAMIFGSMVHCLVLEPQEFDKRYFVLDDTEKCNSIGGAKPRATNDYKAWKQSQLQINAGKELVELKAFQNAQIIATNVKTNMASAIVLSKSPLREQKIDWVFNNFKFHGIIDGLGDNVVFDLKTCADADPKKFQREIISLSYYLQAAMYLIGIGEMRPYYIIAVDKKGGVSVHKIANDLMQHGLKEYEKLLELFNKCMLKENFDMSYDFYSEFSTGHFMVDKPAYLYT